MIESGWTYEYIASMDSARIQALIEAYTRRREEEIKLQQALLGVKQSRGRGR